MWLSDVGGQVSDGLDRPDGQRAEDAEDAVSSDGAVKNRSLLQVAGARR